MKTRTIIPLLCAVAALATQGCSDDSQPMAPTQALKPNAARLAPSSTASTGSASADTVPAGGSSSTGSTTSVQRPISDFLSAQGTYCMASSAGDCRLYAPPVSNMVVWHIPQQNMTIAVDYAGLMDAWMRSHASYSYGTSFNGLVNEEPLSDGRARVTVNLSAMNVMAYMVSGTDLANGPVRFGYKVTDLADQKYSAALGNVNMQLTFIRGAMGRPMPDLVQLLKTPRPDDQAVMSAFRFEGDGELHSEFGQVQKAHVIVSQQGQLLGGYPGMESSTSPMGYADMQMIPQQ